MIEYVLRVMRDGDIEITWNGQRIFHKSFNLGDDFVENVEFSCLRLIRVITEDEKR